MKGKLREDKETKKLNSHDPCLEDEVKLVLYPGILLYNLVILRSYYIVTY